MTLETFLGTSAFLTPYQEKYIFVLRDKDQKYYSYDGTKVVKTSDLVPLRNVKQDDIRVKFARNEEDFSINTTYFNSLTFIGQAYLIIEQIHLIERQKDNPEILLLLLDEQVAKYHVFFRGELLLDTAKYKLSQEVEVTVTASPAYQHLFNNADVNFVLDATEWNTQDVAFELPSVFLYNEIKGTVKNFALNPKAIEERPNDLSVVSSLNVNNNATLATITRGGLIESMVLTPQDQYLYNNDFNSNTYGFHTKLVLNYNGSPTDVALPPGNNPSIAVPGNKKEEVLKNIDAIITLNKTDRDDIVNTLNGNVITFKDGTYNYTERWVQDSYSPNPGPSRPSRNNNIRRPPNLGGLGGVDSITSSPDADNSGGYSGNSGDSGGSSGHYERVLTSRDLLPDTSGIRNINKTITMPWKLSYTFAGTTYTVTKEIEVSISITYSDYLTVNDTGREQTPSGVRTKKGFIPLYRYSLRIKYQGRPIEMPRSRVNVGSSVLSINFPLFYNGSLKVGLSLISTPQTSQATFYDIREVLKELVARIFKGSRYAYSLDLTALQNRDRRFLISSEQTIYTGTSQGNTDQSKSLSLNYKDMRRTIQMLYGVSLIHTYDPEKGKITITARPYESVFNTVEKTYIINKVYDAELEVGSLARFALKIGFKRGNIESRQWKNEFAITSDYNSVDKKQDSTLNFDSPFIAGLLALNTAIEKIKKRQEKGENESREASNIYLIEVNPNDITKIDKRYNLRGDTIVNDSIFNAGLTPVAIYRNQRRFLDSFLFYAGTLLRTDDLNTLIRDKVTLHNENIPDVFIDAEIVPDTQDVYFSPMQLKCSTRDYIHVTNIISNPYRRIHLVIEDRTNTRYGAIGWIKEAEVNIVTGVIDLEILLSTPLTRQNKTPFASYTT